MRRGILVGLAALLLAGAPALAEKRTRSYGGSGADRLTRLIEYGDGLIAVGRTDSRNGDLAMRTRRNQAGWMLCLNSEGAPLWSYCTAKDGRNAMSAPFAHENGQISAVLTGRGIDGLEWLIVSGEGRLSAQSKSHARTPSRTGMRRSRPERVPGAAELNSVSSKRMASRQGRMPRMNKMGCIQLTWLVKTNQSRKNQVVRLGVCTA